MPSQFFGLNIAYTGLLASNAALNTTSNNIANVQTEGYSRQQVTQQAANALRVFQTYGCAGAGVETLSIERIRNEFYDSRYWVNNAKVGEYEQKEYYMTQVESYFDDNGQNAGFKTVFDQMMITGLQALLNNPGDLSTRRQFIGYAGSLAEYFNGVAGNLQKLQKDVNQEIKVKVDEINSIASEIATLNKQINTIELTGSMKANELRDRRTLLLDQLSEIVDIETKETPLSDPKNPDRVTGATNFVVKIASGQMLVNGYDYNELECIARTTDEKVNNTDVDGLYDIYWKDGSKFNIYNAAMGGALKGLVDLRDGNNNENFSGIITDVGSVQITTKDEAGKDVTVNHDTVTVEVGKHYLTDLNKCNLSDKGGIINLGNREYYYDSWTYSVSYDAAGNPSYAYTFTLSAVQADNGLNTSRPAGDRVGKTATVGASISYQGVPYYMSQMNEWVRTFSQKINDIFTSGYTGDIPGIDLFSGMMPTEDDQYVFDSKYRYDLESYEAYQERVKALEDGLRNQLKEDLRNQLKQDNPAWTDEQIEQEVEARKDQIEAQVEAKRGDLEKEATLSVTVGKNITDNDNYYLLSSVNFDVSKTLENDPSRLATKKNVGDGPEQNDLLEDVKKLATDKGTMSYRGSSASEFLQTILGDVALNMQRAEIFHKSYKDIAYNIDTQRISISGVDEDEEAVSLVKYQNGYNLASKMIQTLTEIYDRLILETGV